MRYRLVATDMDGTLLNENHAVADSTRRAIRALQRRGVPVVLVTGRPPALVSEVYRDLGLTGPVIACTGALVCDPSTNRVMAHHPIAKETALQVVAAVRSVDPSITLRADMVTEWHEDRLREWEGRYRLAVGMIPVLGGLEQTLPASSEPVSALSFRGLAVRPAVEAALRMRGLSDQIYITSAGQTVDMVASGVSKGAALRALAAMLSIPMEQTLAIGDDENDIPLLSAAGMSVAMGNATERVKAVARAVTAANSADGWAAAMEEFVLAG